jgi:2-oxoglutarate ferredoxin oxidoreductase subunit beta
MTTSVTPARLAPRDYASDQEVRWCPGCGDYAILKAMQRTLSEIGASPANTVFVSGIGCAARFPYYVATYGFHTIHGRAPAIATGIKLANPDLDVWVITGDGDALSIGGNHSLHLLRRNVDLTMVLFNNEIYGLTKGQYSPTSRQGTRSPSTPAGSVENPMQVCSFALGAGARFVARSIDTAQAHLVETLKRAHGHRGASFVEVWQNCVVYNDGVFDAVTGKDVAPDMQLFVEDGKPCLFGRDRRRGLRFRQGTLSLETVTVGENGVAESDVLVYNEKDPALAWLVASLGPPHFPVAFGVLYNDPAPTYESGVARQVDEARSADPAPDLAELLAHGGTWDVR